MSSGRRMHRNVFLSAMLLLSGAGVCLAQAEEKAKPSVDVNQLDEKSALEFAKNHHPELARLLGPMKTARPREYQKAIREISRVSDRLARMQTRAPDRYAIELDLWKVESRLRLVAVKTAMVDDDERREQIEKMVTERNTLRLKLYEFERNEAAERIVALDKQIEALKAQEPQAVRNEVDRLVNTAKSSTKRVKTRLEKTEEKASAPEKPKSPNPKRAPGVGSASQ